MDRKKNTTLLALLAMVIMALCFVAGYLLRPTDDTPVTPPIVVEPMPESEPPLNPRDPNVVYENDFTTDPGPQWNVQVMNRTLAGDRPYFGGFEGLDRQPLLPLERLPAHKLVRVTFDLFLMKSWDGSSPSWGPGLLDIKLGGADSRSLLHATFSNCGFFNDNNEQSFPDDYPSRPYPAWTLATEHQTLGTIVSWGGENRTFDTSAVYHMVFTFPHNTPDLVLQFKSSLPDNPRKPYGLSQMKVEALPQLAAYTAAELDALWLDLGSPDARKSYDARWKLIAAGDAATDCIAHHHQDLIIPDHPIIKTPGGTAKPYPMEAPVIHRERARWVLEAIHTPAALDLKKQIPTVLE